MENEIWVKIPNFPDYEISNYGRIKSFKRGKEKIMKLQLNENGYYYCFLFEDKKSKKVKPHQLVAIIFLGHSLCGMDLVVDHIDGNKLNNHVSNLRIVTPRKNSINYRNLNSKTYTSKHVGVHIAKWKDRYNKECVAIRACIHIKGKNVSIGTFKTEEEAHLAYLEKLNEISCSEILP